MHRVFVSYHHGVDFAYKEALLELNRRHEIFIDGSVNTRDISESLPDQRIREIIRDQYLRDTTVTIVLVGTETRRRKHVDWEIYSSMINGSINKKSGVLAIELPPATSGRIYTAHQGETDLYPGLGGWQPITSYDGVKAAHPFLPDRLADNVASPSALVSVTAWLRIQANPALLGQLINFAHRDRAICTYDLSRTMRRANS